MNDEGQRRGRETIWVALRWPLAIVGLAVVLLGGYWITLRSAADATRGVGQALRETGDRMDQIAARFRSGTITSTFIAALPEIDSTGSGNLELATSTVTETVRRTDERRILWDMVSLGETVSEIRAPVTYRYHVRMDEEWTLEVSEHTVVVRAPPLRPSLPPAIHTEGLEKHTVSGWLRFDGAQQLAELERSLTPTLAAYAADARHLHAAREESRKTLARFVRGWLLREDHWRQDRFRAVIVRFADEPEEPTPTRPTLELGG